MTESLFEQYKAALRRGHMAALAGQLEDALAAYDVAARLVPDRALPLASRGTVLHRLDRWPEAASAFDLALRLAPDDEAALRARATARAERGMRAGAAADFERLAFVLDVGGRAALAAQAASRAAELEPTDARQALAGRLTAAARLAELAPAEAADASGMTEASGTLEAPGTPEVPGDDPWGAALDQARLEGLDDAATGDPATGETDASAGAGRRSRDDALTYDMQDQLRAGMDDGAQVVAEDTAPGVEGTPPGAVDGTEPATPAGAEPAAAGGDPAAGPAAGGAWPRIDLPSPPPPPMVGPPPDPEELLAEAALVLEAQDVDGARDRMLTAASVHRAAGRIDAALEICLNLLSIAPGDPRVHLAIANLQLDRGWSAVATEKLDLLVRLTSLTGDTQAEADVHGLASERLRDDPASSAAAHRG